MKVVIIGGGITGLTAGYSLVKKGFEVVILEKEDFLGGLASSVQAGQTLVERYYHHFFKSDNNLLDLIEELNMNEQLIWNNTAMGYHFKTGNYGFGTPIELLRFPELSILDKLRFGLIILEMRFRSNWKGLDSISAKDWLIKKGGERLYKKIWWPLLSMKFGEMHAKASAGWLWGRLNPRSKSRSGSMMKEVLGYLEGSIQVLINKLSEEIKNMGGKIYLNKKVVRINTDQKTIDTEDGDQVKYDIVVYSGACHLIADLADIPEDYGTQLKSIKFQSVACLMLELDKSLGDFYWLNNGDPDLLIGGIIEHTRFIQPEVYGRHIVYIFTYLNQDDTRLDNLEKLKWQMIKESSEVYPDLKKVKILKSSLHVDKNAQPLFTVGYSNLKPTIRTPINDVYIAGMSQTYPYDRNIDRAVKIGLEAAEIISSKELDVE